MKEQSIDKIRESSGYSDIGSIEDGAILEMKNIEGRLFVIKEHSIYEFMLADKIDPKRINIGLPNGIQKLVINKGSSSALVGKTFLTAKTLFKREFFKKEIHTEKIILLSLELLQEFIVLESEINKYKQAEEIEIENYTLNNKPSSFAIPSIPNLVTTCKTIFQKADHIEQILITIIRLFYPNEGTSTSHIPIFLKKLEEIYGKTDDFTKFVETTIPFMKTIRELRNGLDHIAAQKVEIKNFELQPDSNIISPTIELKSKAATLERVALNKFLPLVIENMIVIVEETFAYLADKNMDSHHRILKVGFIPEQERKYINVQYAFWEPLGAKGFYHQ